MLCAAAGYRAGHWEFATGFDIVRWAAWIALAGCLLSISGLGLGMAGGRPAWLLVAGLAGAVVGATAAYIPWSWQHRYETLPKIHDISTDSDNPPEFVAVVKLRKPGDNTVTYDGREIAQMQRKAYPDLDTFETPQPKDRVFEATKAAVESAGMHIVDADATSGRIEASVASFFFGFVDDVVIRVSATPKGTAVDVRSKSRTGGGDRGSNADNVRRILAQLKARLG